MQNYLFIRRFQTFFLQLKKPILLINPDIQFPQVPFSGSELCFRFLK